MRACVSVYAFMCRCVRACLRVCVPEWLVSASCHVQCSPQGLECYGSDRGVGHDITAVVAPYASFKEDAASLVLWLDFCRLYLLLPAQLATPATATLPATASAGISGPAAGAAGAAGAGAQGGR